MNNLTWGTLAPITFKGVECQGYYGAIGNGTLSYKITDKKLFDNARADMSSDTFINQMINNSLSDCFNDKDIKVSELSKMITGDNIKEYSTKYTEGKGFEITDITINKIELDSLSQEQYQLCLEKLEESNNNENSNSNETLYVPPIGPSKELESTNNLLPIGIGIVVVIAIIVGVIFILRKNK